MTLLLDRAGDEIAEEVPDASQMFERLPGNYATMRDARPAVARELVNVASSTPSC